jgi:hypothetical protein
MSSALLARRHDFQVESMRDSFANAMHWLTDPNQSLTSSRKLSGNGRQSVLSIVDKEPHHLAGHPAQYVGVRVGSVDK